MSDDAQSDMSAADISAADPYERKHVAVLDSEMAYVETGSGDPIIFLHGNPTSSYLWRNVIPHLDGLGRCLAPDLIGMGRSGKNPGGSYRFADHCRYLDAWFEALGVENAVLVLHDWGGGLGFNWAARNPSKVRAIAYMETIVAPVFWDDWPERAREVFKGMRSEAGEAMVLEKNIFIEAILPNAIIRDLSQEEHDAYRAPWSEPGEGRRPMLTWPRQIPIEGEPADVVEAVETYGAWLARSEVPKLFINADPGSILTGRQREICRAWPNQNEVTLKGRHFVQEDSPHEIGDAVAGFVRGL